MDQRKGWSRRALLQAGSAGVAGLALTGAQEAWAGAPGEKRAKHCIFILGVGGMSQLETWDPKPEAPAELRGPFGAIETRVPGLRISSLLPKLAAQAHRFSLVRSVHHNGPAVHETGLRLIQTGRSTEEGLDWPHLGTVIAHVAGGAARAPAHVVLPYPIIDTGLPLSHGQDAGFLGRALDPLLADGDPADADYAPVTRSAAPPTSDFRRGTRSGLLRATLASCEPSAPAPAFEMLQPAAARTPFEVESEKASLRDRYGRGTFGQSCLVARRLAEAGTQFITVNQFDTLFHGETWDCHGYPDLPTRVQDLDREVAPAYDRAVSALIQDLADRGMLEETLVCCFTEFGRTPRLTKTGGRDHHTGCWSVMLAGGGLKSGTVVGASDSEAAEPALRPVSPAELVATVYHTLGVDLQSRLTGPDGRTHRLLPIGTEPIRELI